MALKPMRLRCGIFSTRPAYVPGAATPLDLSAVKPRTCIS